ncbi:MAG: hypothetical protein RSC41_05560 [Oscillospiraceae bacterium]
MSEELIKNNNENAFDEDVVEEQVAEESASATSETDEITENQDETDENQDDEQEQKSFFEKKQGKEYTYGLKYDDVVGGLQLLANSKKSKSEKTQDIIIYICTAVSLVTALVTKNMISIVAVCLCLGYVYFKTMKPVNYRRRAARMIDKRDDEYKVFFYDTGIKIIENDVKREFLYDSLSYNDHKNLMLLTQGGLVIILPKRYFGDDVDKIKEIFKNNCKSFVE